MTALTCERRRRRRRLPRIRIRSVNLRWWRRRAHWRRMGGIKGCDQSSCNLRLGHPCRFLLGVTLPEHTVQHGTSAPAVTGLLTRRDTPPKECCHHPTSITQVDRPLFALLRFILLLAVFAILALLALLAPSSPSSPSLAAFAASSSEESGGSCRDLRCADCGCAWMSGAVCCAG